ncbi:MAG: HAD-IB family hydrolase [Nitrosomonadaceae bacterium]|nr:HAD-IB family hydrolase [Nitrosomonadaceae bacterium]|tara:strand:+ start:1613 stop:2275 length:663 start_codon:yes stop_codon:yes gene_type:complete
MNLALFDLDNTLLIGDSDYKWAQFLIEKELLDRTEYESRNIEFYEQYKAGTLDIHKFLDFQLQPLSRYSRIQLDNWHNEFMIKKIMPQIAPGAHKLINKHMLEGDLCVIITATNRFVTEPIAKILGISNLIATEPDQDNGEFNGKVLGIPCFREGKIKRLEKWMNERNLTWLSFLKSWFYSDSLNDIPLLNKVSNPIAVDPDPTLRKYATKNNWPIISLR